MATVTSILQVQWNAFLGTLFLFIAPSLPRLWPDIKDLRGKTAIVTGSNSGIGYGIALELAERGANVHLACRNEKKATDAKGSMLRACPTATIKVDNLDVASFKSVRAFAKHWTGTIEILVHNAGIGPAPLKEDFTEDGFEITYQANFLSSFLFTHLLEPHLSPSARIIFTSSLASYVGDIDDNLSLKKTTMQIVSGFHAAPVPSDKTYRYSQSKLMQAAFARALQHRFDVDPNSRRLAFSFEPGLVKSNILNMPLASFKADPGTWMLSKMMPVLGLDVRQGAATGVHLAVSDQKQVLQNKGRYFDRMKSRAHQIDLYSQDKLTKLWTRWSADADISWV